jgi:uncharacterized protein DUF4129
MVRLVSPRAYTILGATAAAVVTAVLASSVARPSFIGSRPTDNPLPSNGQESGPDDVPVSGIQQGGVRISPTFVLVLTTSLVAIFAIGLLILLIVARRNSRPEEPDLTTDVSGVGDPNKKWRTVLTVELRSAAEEQLAAIHLGTPRNAIVACWMALQEACLGAGLSPIVSETADEFTLRAIRGLDLDRRAVSALAALYREARFSDHVMGEHQRDQAGAALRVLAAQLTRSARGEDRTRFAESPP